MGPVVTETQWEHVVTGSPLPAAALALLPAARDWLMHSVARRHYARWPTVDAMPAPVLDFGMALAEWQDDTLLGGGCTNTMLLGWHIDRYPPVGSTNVLTVFREGIDDGYLVIGRTAYTLPEGYAVVFNGQQRHGCSVYDQSKGSRVALTVYVGSP